MNDPAPSATRYAASVFVILLLGMTVLPLADASSVLGFFSDKTYLVVLQDNGEIRNTGGITSVMGLVTVHNGDVTNLSFFYAGINQRTDAPTGTIVTLDGPESFTSFYARNVDLFDANVQYDFATYAPFLRSSYYNVTGQQVDGVIGVDLTALQAMLRVTGPLAVSGQVITSRNVAGQLYAHSATSKEGASAFITGLATALIKAARGLPLALKADFMRSLQQMGSEKHLQFYVPGDSLVSPFNGARKRSDGDFIDVIDYNLGAGKADAGITRTMTYGVALHSDGSSVSNVTLRYDNHNWWEYTVFTTALIPPAATLISANYTGERFTGPSETRELNVTPLTSQLLVASHSTGTVTYTYTTPKTVHGDAVGLHYDLDVHKQAGIDAYTVTTTVQLPPGATLLHATNVGTQTIREDMHVQVIYHA